MADKPQTSPLIHDYRNGGFTIGEQFHSGAIMILGEEGKGFAIQPWKASDPDRLTVKDFAPLLKASSPPDLILLGVGGEMEHSHAKLRMAMTGQGVPLEVQTTPAICRTWNLLLSEGRRAALAAIPVGPPAIG